MAILYSFYSTLITKLHPTTTYGFIFNSTSPCSQLVIISRGGVLENVLGFEKQVLGFALEASSPRKLFCPRLENSISFCSVEILLENARNLAEK